MGKFSEFYHWKVGNVNKKLPQMLASVLGAFSKISNIFFQKKTKRMSFQYLSF